MNDTTLSRWRMWAVSAGLLLCCVGLLLRVGSLTINDPYDVGEIAPRPMSIQLPAERGHILDRNRTPLVVNTDTYVIAADLNHIAVEERLPVAERLAELLDVRVTPLVESMNAPGRKFVFLHWDAPLDVVERVRAEDLPGISVVVKRGRVYTKGPLASNLIGYVDRYDTPMRGLEKQYESEMEGSSVGYEVERDAWRFARITADYSEVTRIHGADLVLTIDEYIQHVTEQALAAACEKHKAKGGCAVVLDHSNGDVLAMASWPRYDPNTYHDFPVSSFRNLAVEVQYEPGSTMKPFTYALALEGGYLRPDDIIDCEKGEYFWTANGRRMRVRDKGHQFGRLTAEEVLEHSSNIGSAKMAQRMGKEMLYEGLRRLGFGQRTGANVRGEIAGALPPLSAWWPPKMENIAFGQGLAVTVMQMAQAYATLANDGVCCPPRVVLGRHSHIDGQFYPEERPEPHRVFSERVARVTRQAMRGVVEEGTGKNAALEYYTTAGKTGTANKIDPETRTYSTRMIIASFAGFVPAANPALTVVVMVDEPSAGETYGGVVAAPAWAEIARKCALYLDVPPDKEGPRLARSEQR